MSRLQMTDRKALLQLGARCETATGPDRELDAEIAVAVYGGEIVWLTANHTMETYPVRKHSSRDHVGGFCKAPVPSVTGSIDHAMGLVPESDSACGERFRLEAYLTNGVLAEHVRASAWVPGSERVFAATPALALTAASLRALAHASTGDTT